MFTQVDTSLERSRGGLGIGLTLVKTLVEMHGGTVEAQQRGAGPRQRVRRPPADRRGAIRHARRRPRRRRRRRGRRRRILIVDDNEDGAESLAMLLQFGGHETHMAHDGQEAIEAAERLRPDVVLLDIGLPRVERLRSVPPHPRGSRGGRTWCWSPLTGWGQEEDRRRSREAGFDAHMVKPVDHDVLLQFLASLPSTRDSDSQLSR